MRLIKLGIISIVVLFVVVLLLSLLIPSHVRVSRAINITAGADSVINNLADLRQWRNWNQMVNDTGLTNAEYDVKAFRSDQLQVQQRSFKNDTVKTVWIQNGKEIVSVLTWHSSGHTTVVQWYFDFYQQWYPWEKFGSIIFDKQLGPSMEKSLASLKKRLEERP